MPPFSMEVKSSSPGVTSGEEMDGSTCGSHVGPRRRLSGEVQKKDKNRDAARKSRRKQTVKADELHMEHQCLEKSNTLLAKEIAALRAEVRRYVAVLERHEPVCPLFALSLTPTPTPTCTPTSTSTSTSASTSIAAAALHHGSSPRPSEAPCSPPDSDVASPDRSLVSEAASALLPSYSSLLPPPYPALLGAAGHRCPASWPGGLATSGSHPSFARSAETLAASSFWDPPPPPPLRPLSSSPTSSSSSSSFSSSCSPSSTFSIHVFDSHPLPPLTPSGRPSSFTPPHPAPAPAPGRASRCDRQGSFAGAGGAVLPHHPQSPYPGVPNDRSYLGGPGHESGSDSYPSGSPGSNMASGPAPYGGFVASGPTPLLPPLALDLVDGLHPAISAGTLATAGATTTTTFPELLQPLCNFSSDVFFSQLLQTEDVLFPDC